MAKPKKKKVSAPKPIKGDYLIVENGNKFDFVKVRSTGAEAMTCVVEKSHAEGKRVDREYDNDSVVLNFGRKVRFGQAYGNRLEPLRSTQEVEGWGELHIYRKMEKGELKLLVKHMKHVVKEMKRHKLDAALPITTEIRNKSGRWSGYYHISGSKYKELPGHQLMTIHPKEFIPEDMTELLFHELGHAVWFRFVTNSQKLRWIRMYTKFIERMSAKKAVLAELLEETKAAGDLQSMIDSLKDAEDEDESEEQSFSKRDVFEECIDYIKSTFHLDKDDVKLLVSSSKYLDKYWPTDPLALSTIKENPAVMTEYGMTSVSEFFAEAFQMYMRGGAAKSIKKAMSKTLSRLIK